MVSEVKAVMGTVRSHEAIILANVPQLTPLLPYLARPTPSTADTEACVVDMGIPQPQTIIGMVVNSQTIKALASSAAEPVM